MKPCRLPIIVLFAILGLSGCVEAPDLETAPPFEEQELDAVLAIVVDMSGSFHHHWEKRAYDMFLELSDRFFTEGLGTNAKLVIGQLSGNNNVLLFEGRPADLRTRFKSREELAQFLKDAADPSRSQVSEATSQTLDYLATMPGMTDDTRMLTVIFSDMWESETDEEGGNQVTTRLKASLKSYRERGGAIALYFVARDRRRMWHELFQEAGFPPGHTLIEGDLSANPQLPRFD